MPPRRPPAAPNWRDARRRSSAGLPVSLKSRSRSYRSRFDADATVAGCPGSKSHRRSRWANSAPTRPRLSQTPRRIASISAADFSGNAAVEIGASDAVFGQQRADGSHEPAGEIRHGVRVGQAQTVSGRRQACRAPHCGIGAARSIARCQAPSYAALIATPRTSRRLCRTPDGFPAAPGRARNRRARPRCR